MTRRLPSARPSAAMRTRRAGGARAVTVRQRVAAKQWAAAAAVGELEGAVVLSLVVADAVELDDVGVVQPGGRLRHKTEASEVVLAGPGVSDQLQGDDTFQGQV